MTAKSLYPGLWQKRWPDPMDFLCAFISANELIIGGLRDFAREIFSRDIRWSWLGRRVDDFASVVEESMMKKMNKWLWRAQFGLGALSHRLDNTEHTARWLMDRYVAELRNFFDNRYRNSIDPKSIYIVSLDEEYHGTISINSDMEE